MTPEHRPSLWLHRLGIRRMPTDESVEWEIEHHISELVDRLVAEGWTAEEALVEAQRRFGDAHRYRSPMRWLERRMRATRQVGHWWDLVRITTRSVTRSLRRSPGFSVAVIATLALGIGANATMYGIVDRLLLQPPEHVADPDRVARVFIHSTSPISGEDYTGSVLTYPDYEDLTDGSQFSVGGYSPASMRTVGSGVDASRASVGTATAEFFPVLGVVPVLGRFFSAAEAEPGSSATAVLGAEYWRSAYGADPGVLGRTIEITGRPYTIVGVAPPGFTGAELSRVDVWLPLELTGTAENGAACLASRGCHWMRAVARLAVDATNDRVEAEATALNSAGRAASGDTRAAEEPREIVLASLIAGRGPEAIDGSHVAEWLSGVSLIVLLIACANVANLLLARGTRRREEVAVRLALGASSGRIAAQVVAESVCLALMGGVVALALARWGGQIVRSTLLSSVYFPGSPITPRLILFTLAAAVAAGAIAGFAPALHSARREVGDGLGATGRSSAPRSRLRAGLTVFQAAMSVVLLVGAGLFVTSLARVNGLDLGFDTDRVLLARLEVGTSGGFDDRDGAGRSNDLYAEAVRLVRNAPGVESVAATSIPFRMSYAEYLRVPGLDSIPRLPGGGPYVYPVTGGYFETVGLSILHGRSIAKTDVDAEADVAVVSQTMARTLWPNADPLGQCIVIARDRPCVTIVGVAEDAARNGFTDDPFMAYYIPPHLATGEPLRGLYVRSATSAGDIRDEVSTLLRSFSPEVRYAIVSPLRALLDPQAQSWKLGATMFTIFGLLALVLAVIGLYGVLAFDVAQRTRELGIRTALGARRGHLLRSVVIRGLAIGSGGVALGLLISYVAAPYARDLLFEVSPREPLILGGVAIMLLTVATLASLGPGLRATRVDPMSALKTD